MPAYKLIYFPVKGRAEMIRLTFAASGVKYEDCRVTKEEFQKLKDSKSVKLNVCHIDLQSAAIEIYAILRNYYFISRYLSSSVCLAMVQGSLISIDLTRGTIYYNCHERVQRARVIRIS